MWLCPLLVPRGPAPACLETKCPERELGSPRRAQGAMTVSSATAVTELHGDVRDALLGAAGARAVIKVITQQKEDRREGRKAGASPREANSYPACKWYGAEPRLRSAASGRLWGVWWERLVATTYLTRRKHFPGPGRLGQLDQELSCPEGWPRPAHSRELLTCWRCPWNGQRVGTRGGAVSVPSPCRLCP